MPASAGPRQEMERHLLGLTLVVLVGVGGGLIALVFGPASLFTALPCLLTGAAGILILWGLATLLEKWLAKR